MSLALLPEHAAGAWLEVEPDDNPCFECPDCRGTGRWTWPYSCSCESCGGTGALELDDVLVAFTPSDFGLRIDTCGRIWLEKAKAL